MNADGPPIDQALLGELREQLGDEVMRSIIEQFLDGNRDVIDILFDRAKTGTDRSDAAHSLKGSCASIGLAGAAALCRALELDFRDQRLEQADLILATLRPSIDQGLQVILRQLG